MHQATDKNRSVKVFDGIIEKHVFIKTNPRKFVDFILQAAQTRV